MSDEDLRLLEQTIERNGTVSGDDARLLIAAVRQGAAPLAPGYRLSVNVLDDHRVRVAIYDQGADYVAEFEGAGSSDRHGTNVLLLARRPPS